MMHAVTYKCQFVYRVCILCVNPQKTTVQRRLGWKWQASLTPALYFPLRCRSLILLIIAVWQCSGGGNSRARVKDRLRKTERRKYWLQQWNTTKRERERDTKKILRCARGSLRTIPCKWGYEVINLMEPKCFVLLKKQILQSRTISQHYLTSSRRQRTWHWLYYTLQNTLN